MCVCVCIYIYIYIHKLKMEVATKALIVLGGDLGIHQTLSLRELAATWACDLPSRGGISLRSPEVSSQSLWAVVFVVIGNHLQHPVSHHQDCLHGHLLWQSSKPWLSKRFWGNRGKPYNPFNSEGLAAFHFYWIQPLKWSFHNEIVSTDENIFSFCFLCFFGFCLCYVQLKIRAKKYFIWIDSFIGQGLSTSQKYYLKKT